ncbi:sensor histidine kinase [Salinarimonas sp. NSM]|uniref:sensor histidine kinase n=1 Tax=Salinarimonas sp. NSM TaxID=3458003 RepID=UPI004036E555
MTAGPSLARTLAVRLTIVAALVALLNLVVVAVYYGSDREGLEAEMMRTELARLEGALVEEAGGLRVADEARLLYAQHPGAYAFTLLDASGARLDGANDALVPAPASSVDVFADDWLTRFEAAGASGPTALVASHTIERGGSPPARLVFVAVGDPGCLLRGVFLDELIGHIWLPLVPALALMLGASVVTIRRSLAPVDRAAAWARCVGPGRPAPDVPDLRLPAEVADLVEAARRSLSRLETALDDESRRAAEAAHALRTPLAVLIARLDGLADGPERRVLEHDLRGLARTVEQVLASARADALVVPEDAVLDLVPVAEQVVARYAPILLGAGRDIELVVEDPAPVRGLAAFVDIALSNLVENATAHGVGAVRVVVGPGASVAVSDEGPGIAGEEVPRLFHPFARGTATEAGGAGLGLSIVARIQKAHGGRVECLPTADGGTTFALAYRRAA